LWSRDGLTSVWSSELPGANTKVTMKRGIWATQTSASVSELEQVARLAAFAAGTPQSEDTLTAQVLFASNHRPEHGLAQLVANGLVRVGLDRAGGAQGGPSGQDFR
jgi:hypothetical protein